MHFNRPTNIVTIIVLINEITLVILSHSFSIVATMNFFLISNIMNSVSFQLFEFTKKIVGIVAWYVECAAFNAHLLSSFWKKIVIFTLNVEKRNRFV